MLKVWKTRAYRKAIQLIETWTKWWQESEEG